MDLEPNSYFIRPTKTSHRREPQPAWHKQAPGDCVCLGAWGSREGRQEHTRENRKQRGVHEATYTARWRWRCMLLQVSQAVKTHAVARDDNSIFHLYPAYLTLPSAVLDALHPHNARCAGGSENPWWKSTLPRVVSSGLAPWTPHHMVTSIFLVLSLVPASPGCQGTEIHLLPPDGARKHMGQNGAELAQPLLCWILSSKAASRFQRAINLPPFSSKIHINYFIHN